MPKKKTKTCPFCESEFEVYCPVCEVIDLTLEYPKYDIFKDESAKYMKKVDPMYWCIRCKYGDIFPFGKEYLAACVTSSKIANDMKRGKEWDFLEITQDAEDATIFKFNYKYFQKVKQKIKAHLKNKRKGNKNIKKNLEKARKKKADTVKIELEF